MMVEEGKITIIYADDTALMEPYPELTDKERVSDECFLEELGKEFFPQCPIAHNIPPARIAV